MDLTKSYKAGDSANIEGGIEGGIYWVGNDCLHGWAVQGGERGTMHWTTSGEVLTGYLRARLHPPRPWYPSGWLDEYGNVLPNVFEHNQNTWPNCRPYDLVETLTFNERHHEEFDNYLTTAQSVDWYDEYDPIVAYRVVSNTI